MKVGILTYHRTLNYGACLQAVATRIVLESMGYEVYYVDYWPEYHKSAYALFSINKLMRLNFLKAIKYIANKLLTYRYNKERIRNFESFFDKYIYPYCKSTTEEFDAIIYGSDQIWRKQKALNDYNFVYFADNEFKTKRHISYAASMGVLPTKEIEKQIISEKLRKFEQISVREYDLQLFCISLGFCDTKLVLDPTLLIDKKVWINLIGDKAIKLDFSYVLVYGIGNVPISEVEIQKYAKEKNCEVVFLHSYASGFNTKYHYYTNSPVDFVSLILNAQCIFTSSFHGLAFSINLNKEFYASFDKNPSRAISLLTKINLMDRLIEPNSKLPTLEKIDYSNVNRLLDIERNNNIKYLKVNE